MQQQIWKLFRHQQSVYVSLLRDTFKSLRVKLRPNLFFQQILGKLDHKSKKNHPVPIVNQFDFGLSLINQQVECVIVRTLALHLFGKETAAGISITTCTKKGQNQLALLHHLELWTEKHNFCKNFLPYCPPFNHISRKPHYPSTSKSIEKKTCKSVPGV